MTQIKHIDSTKVIETVWNINPVELLNSKNELYTIKIVDPLKVVDITDKGFDFGLWFSVLVAVISTSILIWNQIKRSKVYGKVISKTYSQTATFTYPINANEKNTINGQQYLLKLSLSCLRKSLYYKDVKVYLTYGTEKIIGEIYWTKYTNLNFHNSDGTSNQKRMKTPSNDFLTFNNVLEQGKTTFYYLNFIVPNKCGPDLYDKIELEFIKPNNGKVKVQITEIDAKQFFFDDELLEN